MIESGTDSLQLLLSQQHIIFFPATPQRVNVRMFTKNYTVLVILPVLLRMDKGIEPFSLAAPCLRIWNKFPIGCNCFHKDKDKKIKENVYICVIQKKKVI
jgi:hypothetical protein